MEELKWIVTIIFFLLLLAALFVPQIERRRNRDES